MPISVFLSFAVSVRITKYSAMVIVPINIRITTIKSYNHMDLLIFCIKITASFFAPDWKKKNIPLPLPGTCSNTRTHDLFLLSHRVFCVTSTPRIFLILMSSRGKRLCRAVLSGSLDSLQLLLASSRHHIPLLFSCNG